MGIIGLILSIQAIEKPKLTWMLSQPQSIFKKSGTTGLSVLFSGVPVEEDINAIQVQIWNAGKRAIRRQDILRPVRIKVLNAKKLLSAQLVKQNRDIIGAAIPVEVPSEKNSAGLTWHILETGDSMVVQLLIAGNDTFSVEVDGVVEKQREIIHKHARGKKLRAGEIIIGALAVVIICILGFKEFLRWRESRDKKSFTLMVTSAVMCVLWLVIFSIQAFTFFERSAPIPF